MDPYNTNSYYENQPQSYQMSEEERQRMVNSSLAGAFGWMFAGLLITAIAALLLVSNENLIYQLYQYTYGFMLLYVAEIALVLILSARLHKMRAATAGIMFFAYAILNGLTLSTIFLVYNLGTITVAFVCAAGMFGAMAIFGAVTKGDLTAIGSFALMGLFGVILATIINILVGSSFLDMIISYVAVALFLGITAFDVQRIKAMVASSSNHEETGKIMIIGALNLYLDFINIFLRVLRIFGRRK